MSSNSTSSGGGGLSPENVVSIVGMGVSLCLSIITFLTVILTCTYIAVRSKFRDKQDTNIKISTEKTKDGDITSTLNIALKNNESYSLNSKKFDNKKKSDKKEVEKKSTDQNNDLKDVLDNNNEGDNIIANTRSEVINSAYRTFLKTQQIQALGQNGSNKAPLDVSVLRLKQKNNEKIEEIIVDLDENDSNTNILGDVTIGE